MEIILKNLYKDFDGFEVLKDINAKFEDGKLTSILGPSGCGKSTILNIIAGLLDKSSGEIYFGDKEISDVIPEDRNIGMVFQDYALYPHMNSFQNIAFPLKLMKVDKKTIEKDVLEVSNLLQIEDTLKKKPKQLSGGQKQRIAIARALIKKPEILLFDEPLSNIDAKLRSKLRYDIKRIQNELKITTIFVTHDQEEAMSISDKILLLHEGRVEEFDTPLNIYKHPHSLFSAKFIGNPEINLFPAYLENEKYLLREGQVTLPECFNRMNESSEEIIFGVRPEDFEIVEYSDFKVKIISYETLGRETYLRCSMDNLLITVLITKEMDFEIGDEIYIDAKKIHIFKGDENAG